jgi:uncharacterized protein (TIGR03435 family)
MAFRLLAPAALLLLACALAAQTAAPAPAAFEVATVRPDPDGDPNQGQWSLPGKGVFNASHLTLEWVIRLAYGVDAKQIVNEPNWLANRTWNISAKPEAGISLTREELRPRLQALLAERFHLVAHRETREQPGYMVIVGKHGARLTPTKGTTTPGWRTNVSPGHLEGLNWSMNDLAANITTQLARPVIDRPGIKGSYDFSIQYAPDDATDSTLAQLFTALEEKTGLKLQSAKIPVDVVVLDSISETPTPN